MHLCAVVALFLFVGVRGQLEDHRIYCSNTNPCLFRGGNVKLPFPYEFVSSNGEVQVDLTVDVEKLQFEWFTYWRRLYNGKFPGPTWRVKQGDTIKVHLQNNLSPIQPPFVQLNAMHNPNVTNIHTHGLHISSKAPGDDVFTRVHPGESYDFVFNVDSENPAGTYWYHPHVHGSTFLQVQSGMAGMIIIEDPVSDATPQHIQDVSCPNNCEHEVHLVFQAILLYWSPDNKGFINLQNEIKDDEYFRTERFPIPGGKTLADWLGSEHTGPYYVFVNGELFPTHDLTTGVTKRFRMVNAGGNVVLELTITGENGKPLDGGCQYLEIAVDGVYLDKAFKPIQGKSFMVSATRIDWLVVCDKPGIYEVRSSAAPLTVGDALGNAERYNNTLLYLNVTGPETNTVLPTNLPERPWFVDDLRGYRQDQVKGRHVVEVDRRTTLNRIKYRGEKYRRFKVEVGTIQEWYFTNSNSDASHPIHIHVNHFQVISYNKYTGPVSVRTHEDKLVFLDQTGERCYYQPPDYNPDAAAPFPSKALEFLGHEKKWLNRTIPGIVAYHRPGVFHDTIHIPPMSNITIRFAAHKYTGTVVIHCHILKHEDKGMMYAFEITEPGSNLTVYEKVGNGYPGQCLKCDPYPFNEVVSDCTNPPPTGGTTPKMSTTSGVTRFPVSMRWSLCIGIVTVFCAWALN